MKQIDIIWNVTRVCPWKCGQCCVDATYVYKRGQEIHLMSRALKERITLPYQEQQGSIFEQAARWQQSKGLELTLFEKFNVIDNLNGFNVKLDLSGGDFLVDSENIELLKYASKKLGRENITLTATGAGLSKIDFKEISKLINEFNFTFDHAIGQSDTHRNNGYIFSNLRAAKKFKDYGVKIRAECPLTKQSANTAHLQQLYENLSEANVDTLLLMRLFPSGRGSDTIESIPSTEEYRNAIRVLRDAEKNSIGPRIKLQCALKFFDNGNLDKNPCDMLVNSFGLTPDGTLLLSPWAINRTGDPLSKAWQLGNLSKSKFGKLLNNPFISELTTRLDENFGHCKIFAYYRSQKEHDIDRMLDLKDPLLIK